MRLGEKIYTLRTAKNLSQEDLANLLEVSRQSISKWENNAAVPELDKLIKMAEHFGVTLDELVGREAAASQQPGEMPPPQPGETPSTLQSGASTQKIVGIALLCCGFLTLLVFAVLSATTTMGVETGLCLSVPFLLCGFICLTCRHNPGYWCAVGLYAALCPVLTILAMRGTGGTAFFLKAGHFFWGLALLIRVLCAFRSDRLRLPKWGKILLAVLLAATLVADVVSMLPLHVVEPDELIPADF